jgi:hypothetical protein
MKQIPNTHSIGSKPIKTIDPSESQIEIITVK